MANAKPSSLKEFCLTDYFVETKSRKTFLIEGHSQDTDARENSQQGFDDTCHASPPASGLSATHGPAHIVSNRLEVVQHWLCRQES